MSDSSMSDSPMWMAFIIVCILAFIFGPSMVAQQKQIAEEKARCNLYGSAQISEIPAECVKYFQK